MTGRDARRDAYEIVVLDCRGQPMPPSETLIKVGVPLDVAARYDALRKHFEPEGLARWARAHRN